MPSWNIHTAHVERLLEQDSPESLGICDVNAFLFGNYVPDIYVGYMVKKPTRKIEYRKTHFADPGFVPEARWWEFWERYGSLGVSVSGRVDEVVLGALCHLIADNIWNHNVNQFLYAHGIKPGEQTRIRKQGDFDLFGRTLGISMKVVENGALVSQCRAFPQYSITERDVRMAVKVARSIVEHNAQDGADGHGPQRHTRATEQGSPSYAMLTPELFSRTFDEVTEKMREILKTNAAGQSILDAAVGEGR